MAVKTPEPAPAPGQVEVEVQVVATRVLAIGVVDEPGMMLVADGAEMQAVAQLMVVAAVAAGALVTKGGRTAAREKPGNRWLALQEKAEARRAAPEGVQWGLTVVARLGRKGAREGAREGVREGAHQLMVVLAAATKAAVGWVGVARAVVAWAEVAWVVVAMVLVAAVVGAQMAEVAMAAKVGAKRAKVVAAIRVARADWVGLAAVGLTEVHL